MKIKGIIKGNTIELLESISIPDGSEVSLTIADEDQKVIPNWENLEKLIGFWKDNTEINDIFAAIDVERHQDMGIDINLDSIH